MPAKHSLFETNIIKPISGNNININHDKTDGFYHFSRSWRLVLKDCWKIQSVIMFGFIFNYPKRISNSNSAYIRRKTRKIIIRQNNSYNLNCIAQKKTVLFLFGMSTMKSCEQIYYIVNKNKEFVSFK